MLAGIFISSAIAVLVANIWLVSPWAGFRPARLRWAVAAAAFVLSFAYLWEIVDVLARRDWRRRVPEGMTEQPDRFPFVSLHVPAHNEPPEMVIATLQSLLALDYPAYEIVMLDD